MLGRTLTPARTRAIITALLILILGIVLLVIGAELQGWQLTFGSIFAAIGSFLVASVAVSVAMQQWQLASLLEEFFSELRVGEDIKRAGISGFWLYFQDLPWDELFEQSRHLDIVFAYAERWRDDHRHRVRNMLRKDGSRIRVVLPDPEHEGVVASMALQFQKTPEELREKINAARADFEGLAREAGRDIEIFLVSRPLVFTFYRFDTRVVLTTYRHQPGRGDVLTLLGARSGEIYSWLQKEWYGLTDDGVKMGFTRRVSPRSDPPSSDDTPPHER